MEGCISLVVLTYNRRNEVLRSLARMHALDARLPIYLVDNGSVDGTAEAVRCQFPDARIVRLPRNIGAAARNAGVLAARTPYVAFCDDDCWWAPGALERAAAVLDAHPRLAAVTARVLVGRDEHEDEASARMAVSPLPNTLGVPGREVLGLMAGACMMRRSAYLEVGGYDPRLFLGGEELLMALDLMTAGWRMAYLGDVVVHHHPSPARDHRLRRRLLRRNAFWCVWLRRPWPAVLRETARLVQGSFSDAATVLGMVDAMKALPSVVTRRAPVPPHVEAAIARITAFYAGDWERARLETLAPRTT